MSPEVEQKKVSVIVVMGVSGAGKSTIAALLAARLGWTYEDADWFHPPANLEKMHAGKPLTDEDRWPWLEAIAAWIDATRRKGGHGAGGGYRSRRPARGTCQRQKLGRETAVSFR